MTQPPFPGNDFFDQIDSVARNLTGNAYRLKRDDPTAPQKFTEFVAQSEQEFNATRPIPQVAQPTQVFQDFEQDGFQINPGLMAGQRRSEILARQAAQADAQPSMGLLETFITQHPLGRGALGALDVHAQSIDEIAGGARNIGRILPDELPGGYEPVGLTQRETEFDRVFQDARSRGLRLKDAFREARETVGFEQQHIPIGTEETGRHGVSGFLAALGNQIRGDLGQTNVDRNPLFEVGTTDLAIETLADPLFWAPGLGEAGPILKGTRAAVSGTKAGAGAALRQAGQSAEQAAAAIGRTGVGNVLDPVPPQTVAGRAAGGAGDVPLIREQDALAELNSKPWKFNSELEPIPSDVPVKGQITHAEQKRLLLESPNETETFYHATTPEGAREIIKSGEITSYDIQDGRHFRTYSDKMARSLGWGPGVSVSPDVPYGAKRAGGELGVPHVVLQFQLPKDKIASLVPEDNFRRHSEFLYHPGGDTKTPLKIDTSTIRIIGDSEAPGAVQGLKVPTTPVRQPTAAAGGAVDLSEKLALDSATPKLFEQGQLNIQSPQGQIYTGGEIARYWYHRPPPRVPVSASDRTSLKVNSRPKDGGLNAYILKEQEAKAIFGDVNVKGIWLSDTKDYGESSVLVDLTKLDNSNMLIEASGLVHRGNIPKAALVDPPTTPARQADVAADLPVTDPATGRVLSIAEQDEIARQRGLAPKAAPARTVDEISREIDDVTSELDELNIQIQERGLEPKIYRPPELSGVTDETILNFVEARRAAGETIDPYDRDWWRNLDVEPEEIASIRGGFYGTSRSQTRQGQPRNITALRKERTRLRQDLKALREELDSVAPDVTPEQQAIIDDVGTGRPADTPNVARLREEGVINRNTENLQVNDARRVAQNHDLPTDPDLMQAAAQRAIERQGESVTAVDKIVEFLRAAKDAVQTSAAETSRLRRLGTRIGRRRARGISDPARAARAFRSGQAGQRRSREVFEPLIDPETRVFGMIPEEVSNLAPTEAAARIGITGDDLRSLYDAIAAKWPIGGNREWANHNAQVGLTKALLGDVPTDSELRLLREVFGKKIVKELVSRKPGRGRELLFDLVFLLAKTLRSSFDASAPLRQLVVFTVNPRRVKQSAPTIKRMFQVGFTKGDPQKLADQFNDELVNPAKNRHANRLLKLDVDPLDTTVPGGNKRIILHDVSETGAIQFTDKEEIYMSNISAMLPEFGSDVRKLKESRRKSLQRLGAAPTPVRLGIKAVTYPIRVVGRGIRRSELMFGTAINQMRMRVAGATLDNWDEAAREASRQGVPNPVEQESVDTLIDAVNVFTGRGNLPAFLTGRQGSRWLAAIFWAPKLAVSRFQAPLIGVRGLGELGLSGMARVTKASPDSLLSRVANSPGARARKEMAKDLVAFVTTGTTILAALEKFGVAEVETDPRSSDFGKGRIGNTRFDFWGGYQQPARYVWQAATGTQKRLSGENKGELVRLGAFNATKEEEAARAKRTGKPTPPPDRLNLLLRFIQSKIAPGIPALVVNELRGQTFVGDALNEQAALFGEDTGPTVSVRQREAIHQLLPLFGIDVVEAIEAQGFLLGVPLGGSAGLGVGVGTYDTEGEGLGRFDNVTTPAGGGDPWWYKR